ncbi:MAG TPA: hypothetical protein ENG48_06550 [Candidatus Atribacteria bacterium]|nr:hypothetical protein [Candidatus Atribacteria bacterium]
MLEGIGGAIQLAVIDMVLVFAVLSGLALVMVLLKNVVKTKTKVRKKISNLEGIKITPSTESSSRIIRQEETEGKLVAVITAAVSSYLEKPGSEFKILSIRKYEPSTINPWIAMGRQELMLGKNIKY